MLNARHRCYAFLFFFSVVFAGIHSEAQTNQLTATAGWAEVDITPPLGIALGGRGGPETLARKVRDPLFAQLIYLKDSKGKGFVLVSFDLVGLPHELSDRLRMAISQELAVEWNLVLLNASHTHSGPYMIRSLMAGVGPPPPVEIEYFKALEEKIVAAARAATHALSPVTVEVHQGTSSVAINRRGKNKQGKRSMLPDPDGPIDPNVWVMKLTQKAGLSAIVFSYACHPVIVYGFAFADISADFPGQARKQLRATLGQNTHVQFVQGFAGNVRPRVVADLEKHQFRASKPEDLVSAGNELASDVLKALRQPGEPLRLHFAGSADHPFLPRDNPPPRELYQQMHSHAEATTNLFHRGVSEYWLQRYDAHQGFALGDSWSIGLIRLADNQWIVHSAGEPCVEWRNKIETWLSPLKLVTWGYTQEARSYLPTESLLIEGGYEVLESNQARASTPAPFAPGIEAALKDSLLRQLAFIKAQPN
jgi:hypothetical protein